MALIAEYQTSGLSQKEFVAKHDVSFSTFQYWLYRKARASKNVRAESGSESKFLPVELVPSPALEARAEAMTAEPAEPSTSSSSVEIELPAGVRVRISRGASARFIGELLAAMK